MKRILSLLLTLVMVLGISAASSGCGGNSRGVEEVEIDLTFPLSEPIDLVFMIEGTEDSAFKSNLENNKLWKRLKEETNIHITFQFLGDNGEEKLPLLLNSGNYGDVLIGGPVLSSVEASRYIASGIFRDLTPYVNAEYMPNLMGLIEETPEIMSMITGVDGNVYTVPKITQLTGWSIESPFWINKAWLDKLGLSVPETLDEFTEVLRAFATQDPNGNNLQDEIPYLVSTEREFFSLEAIYGCWGMATKSGMYDVYSQVVDGKVRFCPILDEYKEAVKYQAMLYEEGLMWQECFTANSSTGAAKLTSEIPLVGCFTSNTVPTTAYQDDYICMPPPKVEGYEPCWYLNPAVVGAKNLFFVTNKCQYTGAVMKWIDQFYVFENAYEYEYGTPEEGRYTITEDGRYVTNEELTLEENARIDQQFPTLMDLVIMDIRAFTAEDFEKRIVNSYYDSFRTVQEVYADYVTDEVWPRPYYTNQDANTAYRLTTDILYQVTTYRAQWITGKGDIDAEWDEYVAKLKSLGVDELIQVMQNGYDAYPAAAA